MYYFSNYLCNLLLTTKYKTMKKFILIFVLIGQFAIGQVSSAYTFTLSNGTYSPLVNKTVFQSGSQLNTDAVSGAISLPFAFTMYGKVETVAFVSNNGFVTFGSPQTTVTTYAPISSTVTSSAFDNLISGFGNQIVASQSGNPEISYGQNANNDFVFQYQDVGLQNSLTARFTFQIIIKPSGIVQIVFGPNCTGGEVNSRTSQIGLRGKQTPRPGATPITTVFNNLTMGSGNYNIFQPNNNYSGGIAIGKTNASSVATRQISGMVMPTVGLTLQFLAN